MYTLNLRGKIVSLACPQVMAIINITPDSFYTSCTSMSEKEVLTAAECALEQGALLLDLGGYSTRPGAQTVSADEELARVAMAAACIRKHFPEAALSVDTFRSSVARRMVSDFGVEMINDVSGGTLDADMFATVAETGTAYILTHMRGTPQTMQQCTHYDDLMADVLDFFQTRIYQLKQLGVKDIIIDPGFGFAKTMEQNYELLQKMDYLEALHLPILAGLSHKSMLYKLLGTDAQHTLNATTAANTVALLRGASILRVHEVREAMEAIKIVQALG